MKTKLIFFATTLCLQFLICAIISAQNVLISTSAGTPDASAGLEVKFTDKGMLIPRVALTTRDNTGTPPISSPANGLWVYNTATAGSPPNDVVPGFYYWSTVNNKWNPINGSGTAASNMQYWDGAKWALVNAGTSAGQFLRVSSSSKPTWAIEAPTLTTITPYGVTPSCALSGGIISNDGGAAVTARGVCWNTTGTPTISDDLTSDGSPGITPYGNLLIGLSQGQTYHIRAYATNSAGTSYGNECVFVAGSLPILSTTAVSSITNSTASSGGNITNDGGSSVTARGVCWKVTSKPWMSSFWTCGLYNEIAPTISDNKTTDGSGTGTFASSITGLTPNTDYWVRAYATNSTGTQYGDDQYITTAPGSIITDADGNNYGTVTLGTQTWMMSNLKTTKYNDSSPISNVTGSTAWANGSNGSAGAYCYYSNTSSNSDLYGCLYDGYAINNSKLCPSGWHVPSYTEWGTLTSYLSANGYGNCGTNGSSIAKSMASTNYWTSINDNDIFHLGDVGCSENINNHSKLAIYPGGWRSNNGSFANAVNYAYIAGTYNGTNVYNLQIYYQSTDISESYSQNYKYGLSVRCLKN